jgi:allantoinase
MALDYVIRAGQLVLSHGIVAADIGIADGAIVAIEPDIGGAAREIIDATGLHVFPGVVDAHVHFNEPGRDSWEGAATGSAALASGGGVCFCDMPLNASPPTLDGASFDLKRASLEKTSFVDFALWGGLCRENLCHLDALADRGVIGFKAFMCNSGIEDFPSIDDESLGRGMESAARLRLPVAVHAEDEVLTSNLTLTAINENRTSIRDFLASRPIRAEVLAIERAISLAAETGCSLHIVHVSSGDGARAVFEGRARGVDVTCETCPHYLTLTAADIERIGAAAKCCPPVRDANEQDSLWAALKNGGINFVASDHSPAPWSLKESTNFFRVWGGIAGCQTTLGLLIEEGHVRRGIALSRLADFTSRAPAARFGLAQKGRFEIGADADLTLVDLAMRWPLCTEELHYRHKTSPFVGQHQTGKVKTTLVRGRTVFASGQVVTTAAGKFVRPIRQAAVKETAK